MRSHRRQGPLEHVLVAGDLTELDAIAALLSFLPEHAYGQVYVETPATEPAPSLPTPARVAVTRIARDADAEPGALLGAAVSAWAAEWLPEQTDEARALAMWVGATACDRVNTAGSPLERL